MCRLALYTEDGGVKEFEELEDAVSYAIWLMRNYHLRCVIVDEDTHRVVFRN